ncbi:MAG TPA: HDOD domain-containing protein [Myxococcota bacterium]|nr:HDOD domain-containing protein [Myxococcota bacterium]
MIPKERLARDLQSVPMLSQAVVKLIPLVIGHYLHEHLPEVLAGLQDGDQPLIGIERQILGCDHSEVGASVARMWNLPEELVEGIRHHHDPSQAPSGPMQTMADLVHVADALAHMFGFGCDVGGLRRAVQEDSAMRLGLSAEHVDEVVTTSVPDIEERVSSFFQAA